MATVIVLSLALAAALGNGGMRPAEASTNIRGQAPSLVVQGGKVIARGEIGSGGFGFVAALSADGSTALISAVADDHDRGAVWVYVRGGRGWEEQARLTGGDEIGGAGFGGSVALSADGNTAVIGGPADDRSMGAVWVFTRSGSDWHQRAKLVGAKSESGAGGFGYSVAVSDDGTTVLVGAPGDHPALKTPRTAGYGAVWVFKRVAANWVQLGGKLTGSADTLTGELGWRVALSGNGETAIVGGLGVDNEVGAVWIFAQTPAGWRQVARLTGRGETRGNPRTGAYQGEYGYSVALSADGVTALVGAPGDERNRGGVWVYTRAAAGWRQQGPILAPTGEIGQGGFGEAIAVSAHGNTVLISAPLDNNNRGAAWLYGRTGGRWTQDGEKVTGRAAPGLELFGSGLAVSQNATIGSIGAQDDNDKRGAAWFYRTTNAIS